MILAAAKILEIFEVYLNCIFCVNNIFYEFFNQKISLNTLQWVKEQRENFNIDFKEYFVILMIFMKVQKPTQFWRFEK